jgi:hypothetical protein
MRAPISAIEGQSNLTVSNRQIEDCRRIEPGLRWKIFCGLGRALAGPESQALNPPLSRPNGLIGPGKEDLEESILKSDVNFPAL